MAPMHTRGRGCILKRPVESMGPETAESELDSRGQGCHVSDEDQEPQDQRIPLNAPVSKDPTWVMDKARIPMLARSLKDRFTLFHGESNPWIARAWLDNLEDTFEYMTCTDGEKVGLAIYHLRDQAFTWWKMEKTMFGGQEIQWSVFKDIFERQYFPTSFRMTCRQEFLSLKQGDRSVMEYNAEFTRLAEFSPNLVMHDGDRMFQFTQGLAAYIRIRMSGSSISTYREALDRAIFIEMIQQQVTREKKTNKQFSQGKAKDHNPPCAGQKRQKRNLSSRDSIGESFRLQKSSRHTPGSSRGTPQNGKKGQAVIRCFQCGSGSHSKEECPLEHSICFYCKLPGHFSRDCTLRAQLESSDTFTQEKRATQSHQQKTTQKYRASRQQQQLPPQAQLYQCTTMLAVVQPSVAPVTYYSGVPIQQYLPAGSQVYVLSPQQIQQSISVPQSQIQPEWRHSIAHLGTQPPSAEPGRIFTTTREEAQRADGAVI